MRPLALAILISQLIGLCSGATIQVPGDYPKIQQAMDASAEHDTILVAPGTFVENLDFKGKNIHVISSQGPVVTIIDGGKPVHPDHGSVVMFRNGENSAKLKGFTLTNGSGTLSGFVRSGGGVLCDGSSPSIVNNRIINNRIDGFNIRKGGGISCLNGAHPLIELNLIQGNSAESVGSGGFGGGIHMDFNSNPNVRHNTISNNSSANGGGVMSRWSSDLWIQSNVITGNTAESSGGGIYIRDGDATIRSNLIWNNVAKNYSGGGIVFDLSMSAAVNNTMVNNTSNEYGGGVFIGAGASIVLVNMIFWENEAPSGPQLSLGYPATFPSICSISYSDLQGGKNAVYIEPGCHLNWDFGMIDQDPLFADPLKGDFHLTHASPCRNAGDTWCALLSNLDFEMDHRIHDSDVDMGADEFHKHMYCMGQAIPGGAIELKFVDDPNTSPVYFWLGSGVLKTPLHLNPYGHWYLEFPILFQMDCGSIPSPKGVLSIPFSIPNNIITPLGLHMQSYMGNYLSNPLEVWIQ